MMKTLRLQVSIRFFSLLPSEEAKSLLRNAHELIELIERSKKQEALWRSERSKEDKHIDEGLFDSIYFLSLVKMLNA